MSKYTVNHPRTDLLVVSGDEQEEQHANTSANYDVELLHHRDAHLEFFKNGRWNERKSPSLWCRSLMDLDEFLS